MLTPLEKELLEACKLIAVSPPYGIIWGDLERIRIAIQHAEEKERES